MPLASSKHTISSFRDLKVWQFAMDFVVEIYAVTATFPKDERFGLTIQLRRAAVSIPANIAEGNARYSKAEYRHFVSVSRGSLAEVETELLIAERLGYVDPAGIDEARKHASSIGRMLTNLYKSLRE